jgi:hypothetical protein
LRLTQRLPCSVDLSELQADLDRVERSYPSSTQDGPHHNGRWKRLGLVSPDGDPYQAFEKRGQQRRPTPVLDLMPSVRRLMDDMAVPVRGAFISVMEPGARVRWHRDASHSIDLQTVRLHMPVVTAPSSTIRICHETAHWPAGQLWYADFSFPHSVQNDWNRPRVHLIFDLRVTDEVRALFSTEYRAATQTRSVVRKAVARMFDFSERLHPEGRKAIRARAERRAAQKNIGHEGRTVS